MRSLARIVVAAMALGTSIAVGAAGAGAKDINVRVERDGNTFTVSTELTVAASGDEVWDVLTDFDHMAEILSNVDVSRIANRDGNRFDVIQKSHAYAGPIRLSMDIVRQVELTPKREIRSRLLKGDLKSSDFQTLISDEGNVTRVTVNGKFVAGALGGAAITPERVQAQTQQQYQELHDEVLRRKSGLPPPPCLVAKNCAPGPGPS